MRQLNIKALVRFNSSLTLTFRTCCSKRNRLQ